MQTKQEAVPTRTLGQSSIKTKKPTVTVFILFSLGSTKNKNSNSFKNSFILHLSRFKYLFRFVIIQILFIHTNAQH